MKKPGYADIADFSEDRRIDMIGKAVTEGKKTVNFITDSDEGKAERYIKKLLLKFPDLIIIKKFKGPVPNTVVVKVGPKS